MGEDIHFRVLLKSRKTGKYINAHDICEWDPKYSIFQELVEGRNYEVFSLLGSRRADYAELSYANYGIPDCLQGSIFDDYCRECGYYGFIWFKLPDLVKAVNEYIEKLKDPLKYLDPDSPEYQDWKDFETKLKKDKNCFSEFISKYWIWLDTHRNVMGRLKEMSEKLQQYTDIRGNREFYDKFIDLDETIFLFFFDN